MRAHERLRLSEFPAPFRLLSGVLALTLLLLALAGGYLWHTHTMLDVSLKHRVHQVAAAGSAGANAGEADRPTGAAVDREALSLRHTVLLVMLSAAGFLLVGAWLVVVRVFAYHVAARRHALRTVSESETRNIAMLQALPDAVFLLDRHGRFLDYHAPPGGGGFPGLQLLGHRLSDVVAPEMAAPVGEAVETTLATGVPQTFEFTLPAPLSADWEREERFEARVVPCGDEDVLAVVRNITGQVRAGDKFRILVEQSLTGIYIIHGGRFLYVNPRFAEIFGYTPEELMALDHIEALAVPEDRMRLCEELGIDGAPRDASWSTRFTLRGMRRDGTVVFVDVYGSSAEYEGKDAVVGTLLDVTEQRAAQEKLRILFMAVEQSAEGVLVIDTNGMVRFVNPAWTRMHGYTVEEVTGAHFRIFHTEEQMRREVFPVIHRFENTRIYRAEMGHKRKDGTTFPSTTAFASIRDDDGQVVGAVAICRDITDQKQYEAELVEAKERAEEVSRMKSSFLTNMSHEIRTPLTGIIGFAKVLEEEIRGEQQEFAQMIQVSGERLMATLNAVMDLARLEAGEMIVDLSPVDLRAEVDEVVQLFRMLAAEKGLGFDVSYSQPAITARIDTNALSMILSNLLGNALKFTEEGAISVDVVVDGDDVNLRICDTGVGIDPQFLPHLFDEFKQESVGLTRSHEGSGLGLAITKRLVDLMGGHIAVTSVKGEGSTFAIAFPDSLADALEEEPEPASVPSGAAVSQTGA